MFYLFRKEDASHSLFLFLSAVTSVLKMLSSQPKFFIFYKPLF